jgi:hypothetical protein
MAQQILPSNTFTTAKWIVSATASDGTHTTIASALTSSSSGDTIFIRPGTYTENLTLKAGVNLTAFGSDSSLNGTGNVIISGTCTFTGTGTVDIYGIQLQTNSAALLAVTGSNASIVNLDNCYLNCSNNTGITFSASNASAAINIKECMGNIGTTGISLFTHTSTGALYILGTEITNSGAATTASTISAGTLTLRRTDFRFPITSSSTATFDSSYSRYDTSAQNTTSLTCGGSGTHTMYWAYINSGSASAISISNTTMLLYCVVGSSNTNAVTGAGTLNAQALTFSSSSITINTTTQTSVGLLIGMRAGNAPPAGFIGEQIRSYQSSPQSISNNTNLNITSISLTAGIWDVTGLISFNGTITGVAFSASISTTSATLGSEGDNYVSTPTPPTASVGITLTVPNYRLTLSATTTVYLVARGAYSVGSLTGIGRISGTRVG